MATRDADDRGPQADATRATSAAGDQREGATDTATTPLGATATATTDIPLGVSAAVATHAPLGASAATTTDAPLAATATATTPLGATDTATTPLGASARRTPRTASARGPRELPQLAPAEVLAVLVIAVLPLGDTFPYAALLLAVAATSLLLRRRSWRELIATGQAARALAIGVAAGAVAVAIATPAIGAFRVTALDWWVIPALHGDATQIAAACGVLLATAVAMELALRGWVIVRMLELSPGPPGLPVAVAALAEAFVTPGPIVSRLGVALFSAGLGTLFTGCGRNVLAPIAARCTFVAGTVLATSAFGM